VLASTVRLVESSYRNKVEFKLEIDQLPPVMGITGQIQQVLMNLLINACQAIQDKGFVTLRSRREDECAVIEVHDTGGGIAADVLPQIFEPYFSTKSVAEGTGLGLPISRRIVEGHGGRLDVASTPGQGAVFTIRLPIEGNPALAEEPDSPYDL
jgi:two-component system NtrC family sensor kinase